MAGKSLVRPSSLVLTLDAINDALFFRRAIAPQQARQAAQWIAARSSGDDGRLIRGSYRGMPAPTEQDFAKGIRLFTGEAVYSRGGMACKAGFEACRAMALLDSAMPAVKRILASTDDWIARSQKELRASGYPAGMYCCASCSAAMWRALAGRAGKPSEGILADGLRQLKGSRMGHGKWRRYPFFYTLLAVSEIDLPAARAELKYAAAVCEKVVRRAAKDQYAERRKALAERVLAIC